MFVAQLLQQGDRVLEGSTLVRRRTERPDVVDVMVAVPRPGVYVLNVLVANAPAPGLKSRFAKPVYAPCLGLRLVTNSCTTLTFPQCSPVYPVSVVAPLSGVLPPGYHRVEAVVPGGGPPAAVCLRSGADSCEHRFDALRRSVDGIDEFNGRFGFGFTVHGDSCHLFLAPDEWV